ncbi:cancer-associated gene 1 protein isoform X1 [Vicugna pacos]|uniref:Cancer-associated gene 1 protein isoform X1 n=1 Tax=Vicugna pacos TaxID=30538 RepID=A0ABM5BZI2_VICPA
MKVLAELFSPEASQMVVILCLHMTFSLCLGGVSSDLNIGNYSQNVLNQPVDINISSFRQFEPLCKFHQREAFNNEMITFQNLTEGLPYAKEPELQCHVYNDAKDTNIQKDSFKEESPVESSTSADQDQLALECVRQSPRSPSLIHCTGGTLKFMEVSLANSTAMETAFNPSQPQNFLCKENVHGDVEQLVYKENSFHLLNQRANYKAEEIAGSSKGIQNSADIPEMSVKHQKEVAVEGRESSEIVSCWSPIGISWSGGASREGCMTPNTEQSLESPWPLEEDMALNEVLRKLKHTNREQQTLIQDLQRSNMYLEKKVEELQMKTTKQQVSVDIMNKLKENVEELIEDKYRVMLEKNDTEKTLRNVHEVLVDTQQCLQESRNEKETLQQELKKIKSNYVSLQERYTTEMQQKKQAASQCLMMDRALSKKEEEVERLQQLKEELEEATASALGLLKREQETREQELLSLQEEFQKREKENLDERRKLKSRLEKLVAQVQNLQFTSENEKAKNTKLQQQIDEVRNENAKLQQQVARSEEQNYVPKSETVQLKERLEEVMESDMGKDAKMIHSDLFLTHSPCEGENLNPPDMKRMSPLTSKIHSLLALMVGLLTCQDITSPDAEHFKETEKVSDIMLQKLKTFHLKKNNLDKELLKHKDRITTFRELIANEKSFQDQVTEVTDFDSNETKNVRDIPVLLGAKLDQYHNLNEELDFLIAKLGHLLESKKDHCNRLIEENDKYQRHLGSLINKVTSYEEIIECADQRLVISHSQIARLEERNKHLEDLIRRPREKARRPRRRSHQKSMTVVGHTDDHCKECYISICQIF